MKGGVDNQKAIKVSRLLACVLLARVINSFSKILNLGSGFTWPGHAALKIYPNVLRNGRLRFSEGVVLVTGTNGKTTTASLLTHILRSGGYRVTHNKTGANLLNGAVSSVLLDASLSGRLSSQFGVFEADELSLPTFLKHFSPRIVVLLNLSRDQLDRSWEVDLVFDRWAKAISNSGDVFDLVIDGTQARFARLKTPFASSLNVFDDSDTFLRHTTLRGAFSAKNVNAAVCVSKLLGFSQENIVRSLKTFSPAYGRGEVVGFGGKSYTLLLAKNPASFNNNLKSVVEGDFGADALCFVLNDEVRDGRDVSWIYDVDPDLLFDACRDRHIFVSGTRCFDMAVRLEYAGVDLLPTDIAASYKGIVARIGSYPNLQSVLVLPNYSAMLKMRKVLTGRQIPADM